MILRSVILAGSVVGVLLTVGCSTAEPDTDTEEGNLIAPGTRPTDEDAQRKTCELRVRENGALRDQDLAHGVVRWKCGDVAGVSGSDHGQEYCEFHAIQEGVVLDDAPKSKVKPAKIECVFSAVYGDVRTPKEGAEPPKESTKEFGERLNRALTDEPGNLKDAKGKTLPNGPRRGNPFSVMDFGANTRNAAEGLLADCGGLGPQNAEAINAASDEKECDAAGTQCSSKRDVEACTLIFGHGEGFRNSDPVICGRAARGSLCGGKYGELSVLDGFLMTDWNADLMQAAQYELGKTDKAPSPPDGCRYATVDGKAYLHLLICTPTQAQVTNPKFEGHPQEMCNSVFGPKIAMTAPLGLVTTEAKGGDAFCDAFSSGVDALKNGVK